MPATAHKKAGEHPRTAPVSAPLQQREAVRALAEALAHIGHGAKQRSPLKLEGRHGERTDIPASVLAVLEQAVAVLARGEAVTIVPVSHALTTQEAADLLNVSRQYLVRLLNEQAIPHTMTGKHRRLRLGDVLAYKRRRDSQRNKALSKLTQLSQDYGLYDDLR